MAENDIYNQNYFFRDYVSEEICAYGVGPTWYYHFKETLIGIRDNEEKKAWFADFKSVKDCKSSFVPTMDQLTEEHIKEAIAEIDTQGETLAYVNIDDLQSMAKELLCKEVQRELDANMTGASRNLNS